MTTTDPQPGGTFDLAGVTVSRVGFGAMQLVERGDRPALDPADAVAVIRRALDLGVNHLDTADFYGFGEANELVRRALDGRPGDARRVAVATKVGAVRVSGATPPLVPAQRPDELRAQVQANLASLGTDRLDVVNLRRADRAPGIIATGDQVVDLDDQLAELIALRDEGLIGGIGLSSVTLDQLRQALPAGIVCVQNAYNLLHRGDEPLLDLCETEGIAWVPYFPLGSAFPAFPKVTADERVIETARRNSATPSQIGLAWLLQRSANILLIPGTSSAAHLAENVGAGAIELDAATMDMLGA